jgi:conjugative transposon TraN protein
MKATFLFLLSLTVCCAHAQNIELSSNTTSSLHFPSRILHVDRGSKEILAQAVPGDDRVLLLKAVAPHFAATNLTVITSDGSIYVFGIAYADSVAQWNFELADKQHPSIEMICYNLLDNPPAAHGMRAASWDMHARVTGIYSKGNTMFYQLRLKNRSPIDYDMDFIRFYIRDRRTGRRTAVQETELTPLYRAGSQEQVKARETTALVFAFDRFTIPDAKICCIEIHEKNGGRHLLLRVRNRRIIKAITL